MWAVVRDRHGKEIDIEESLKMDGDEEGKYWNNAELFGKMVFHSDEDVAMDAMAGENYCGGRWGSHKAFRKIDETWAYLSNKIGNCGTSEGSVNEDYWRFLKVSNKIQGTLIVPTTKGIYGVLPLGIGEVLLFKSKPESVMAGKSSCGAEEVQLKVPENPNLHRSRKGSY